MPDKQCLCGSGKKKGSCCGGNSNVIDINQYRRWRTGQHLRGKLAEFADSELFINEIEMAREQYFSVLDPELLDEEDDFLLERFFEWFIFDFHIRGRSVLEYFSLTGGLTSEEKALLDQWKRVRSSVYQVVHVNDHNQVTLRDLLREGEIRVTDRQAARELEPGLLLFIRVLPLGVENEFSTGGLLLPAYCKSYLLNRIRMDQEIYWSKQGKRGKCDQYLRDRGHVLNAMIMEIGSLWDLPRADGVEILTPQHDTTGTRVDDVFLEQFYERWINEPMELLNGKTPLEAYKTKAGRQKLQKLLLVLENTGGQNSDSPLDLSALWERLNREPQPRRSSTRKPEPAGESATDGRVIELIRSGLNKMGYRKQHINSALEIWRRYNSLAHPRLRKPGAWAAAVIYALARTQGHEKMSQNDLARMFNVSASTISNNYSSIRRTLQLEG